MVGVKIKEYLILDVNLEIHLKDIFLIGNWLSFMNIINSNRSFLGRNKLNNQNINFLKRKN